MGAEATRIAWDPAAYGQVAAFVPALGRPLLELVEPRPGLRVLDLGCGDGALTAELIAAGCDVVGVDASPAMVAAAQARGIDARIMDGQALTFQDEFDACLSNAALHWMARDPQAVVDGVFRALKPGGRFAGEFGGAGNVAQLTGALGQALATRGVDPALVSPWFNPTAEGYAAMLRAAGFQVREARLFPRPTPLPDGLRPWLRMFCQAALDRLDVAQHEAALDEAVTLARPALYEPGIGWHADYVRLRFVAEKPA